MNRLIHSDMDRAWGDHECSHCSRARARAGEQLSNMHTLHTDIRTFRPDSTDDPLNELLGEVLVHISRPSTATTVTVADGALRCWCGHSLHFADCPDDGACHLDGATDAHACLRRYKSELN